MYFDDLTPGFTFETASRTLSEEAITGFAREWDPQPFHLDHAAAAETPYGGLIASGFHTLLTGFVLVLETGLLREASLGSPGIDELRWLKPVRPGDTLRCRGLVLEATPSASRPDRGRATIAYEVLNQQDEVVCTWKILHMLRRRP